MEILEFLVHAIYFIINLVGCIGGGIVSGGLLGVFLQDKVIKTNDTTIVVVCATIGAMLMIYIKFVL